MSTSSPTPRRLLRSGWWIFAGLALCLVLIALRFGLPIWRRAAFITEVRESGGRTWTNPAGPDWLRKQIGASGMEGFDSLLDVFLSETKIAGDTLHAISLFPELQSISLRGSVINSSALVVLGEHPGLISVDLFESTVDDVGLAALSQSKSIVWLYAGYTRVTDSGLIHLGRMTQLEHLGLRGDDVTDAGLTCLSSLTNLTDLNLSETAVSDTGLRHLAPLKKLQHVWLFDSAITEAGVLDFVASHYSLQEIELSPDQISADGMDDLKRQRPNLKIVITVEENDGSGFSRRRSRRQ